MVMNTISGNMLVVRERMSKLMIYTDFVFFLLVLHFAIVVIQVKNTDQFYFDLAEYNEKKIGALDSKSMWI